MFSKINNITLKLNEPLSKHCSFKIGGNAKYFIAAHSVDALLDCLETCKQHSIPHKLIGGGSNILFDDLGYSGAIIKYDDNTISMILCKNGSDCIRMYNMMSDEVSRLKTKQREIQSKRK